MNEPVNKIRMVFFYISNKKEMTKVLIFLNLSDIIYKFGIRGILTTLSTAEGRVKSNRPLSVRLSFF